MDALTDMPAIFQKTIDKTHESINSKFAFLGDIPILTKDLENDELELDKVVSLLGKENLAKKLQKLPIRKVRINMSWI